MSEKAVEYNKDELEPPTWLDDKFFTDVLKHAEKSQKIEVTNLKLSPATAKGDHYASVMFRAVVDYRLNGKKKHKSMILKTMPEVEGNKKEFFENSHIFETEIGNYTEIIPKFESILRAAGDNTILGPPLVYYALSPKKLIILEDITPMGYSVLRGRNPTLEEAKAAYTKIAKWHAVGYKLNLEEPQYFDKYRHSIFNIPHLSEDKAFTDGVKNFLEMLNEHDDLKEYKKYFEPLSDSIMPRCKAAFNEYRENKEPTAIYGLCHGDFHFKNMMFKYAEKSGKFEDVMLLDYQMSYVGPIVNDILYSKYMTLNAEQRAKHWDEVVYHYVTTFQGTLKRIGFKGRIPKIIDFRQELVRQKVFEIFLFTTFLPIWDSFSDGKVDIDEMIASPDSQKKLFRNQKYVDEVRTNLPRYLYRGYLDF